MRSRALAGILCATQAALGALKSENQGKRGAAGLGVRVGTSILSGAGDQLLFVVHFIAYSLILPRVLRWGLCGIAIERCSSLQGSQVEREAVGGGRNNRSRHVASDVVTRGRHIPALLVKVRSVPPA